MNAQKTSPKFNQRESDNSMKVGYLMQNGAPDLTVVSGPQLHTIAVIHGLQKLGNRVRTIANQQDRLGWTDDLDQWFPPQYSWTQAKWFRLFESFLRRFQFEFRLPFLCLFDSLHFADACIQQLKGTDILYERHGYLGYGGVIAARWLKIPLILELNGNIIKEIDEIGVPMSPVQRRLGRWITLKTWQSASHIVVVSEALKHQIISLGIPEEKISVVQNGVNIDLFTRSYDVSLVRDLYKLGPGPIIVFVGSFQPWHGVDLLVSSFRHVHSRFPESVLLLVGDGAGKDAVNVIIADFNLEQNVRMLGRLDQRQVAEVLSAAEVAVAPYPFIHGDIVGSPLKIVEYMAASKAIVASTSSIHEVIEDGVTGIRVAPANEKQLAQGIIRLLSDAELRAKIGKNARRQAEMNYSWDKTVEKIQALMVNQLAVREMDTFTYERPAA